MRRLTVLAAILSLTALAVVVLQHFLSPGPEVLVRMEVAFHRPGWDRALVLVNDPAVLAAVGRALEGAVQGNEEPGPDTADLHVVRLHWAGGESVTLWVTDLGRIYDPGAGAYVHSLELPVLLSPHVHRLRREFFGEPAWWGDVHRLFHYETAAEIEDLETGRRFHVFRYGGVDHADLEPLTALDSAIMEGIYGGEWSWRRRAAILHMDGRRLAASMTGMPHMGYKILDNDYEGHFCLHLEGSVIHGPRNVDVAHHIMYKKAAGLLSEIVSEQDPGRLAVFLLTALGHGDGETALAMLRVEGAAAEAVRTLASAADGLYADQVEILEQSDTRATVRVSFSLHFTRPPGERRLSVTMDMERAAPGDRWVVEPSFLESMKP